MFPEIKYDDVSVVKGMNISIITTATNDICIDFRGLSTDTKPIGKNCVNGNCDMEIGNGSTFLCMDNSSVWVLKITLTNGVRTGEWIEL
mgnify:CR=1 FL=1